MSLLFFVGLTLIIILVLGIAVYFVGRRVFPAPPEDKGKGGAVVVLGRVSGRSGGRHPVVGELVKTALPLYKKKTAGVILCGEKIAAALIEAGVPENSLIRIAHSSSVRKSLAEAKTILEDKGLTPTVVVAEPWELREAYFYAKELGLRCTGVKAPVPLTVPSSVVAALFVFVFSMMFAHAVGRKFGGK